VRDRNKNNNKDLVNERGQQYKQTKEESDKQTRLQFVAVKDANVDAGVEDGVARLANVQRDVILDGVGLRLSEARAVV
jgi:hypothetical protein